MKILESSSCRWINTVLGYAVDAGLRRRGSWRGLVGRFAGAGYMVKDAVAFAGRWCGLASTVIAFPAPQLRLGTHLVYRRPDQQSGFADTGRVADVERLQAPQRVMGAAVSVIALHRLDDDRSHPVIGHGRADPSLQPTHATRSAARSDRGGAF